ncbi:MAG: SDR family oxidoreductase [Pseudomonadota bacterium]|nr:SDR family oxidoreductase [Pseudomonadota bacterium]
MTQQARFDFSGSFSVVTGAAHGIGEACARLLAESGSAVALWDMDLAAAQTLTETLRAGGANVLAIGCDVARKTEVEAALAATLAAFGRVDVLINNAGIFRAAPFLEIEEADWDAVLDVNLKGAFLVGQAVARAMKASGGGAIVNMSSVNGVLAIPNIASYNASKGGVNQLTRAMALSLADANIRVNAVAPGTIATELARKAVLDSAEAEARILGRTPLGRLGLPHEVAQVCAFLASDAAAYMTGEVVVVDGGRLALNYTMPPRAAEGSVGKH